MLLDSLERGEQENFPDCTSECGTFCDVQHNLTLMGESSSSTLYQKSWLHFAMCNKRSLQVGKSSPHCTRYRGTILRCATKLEYLPAQALGIHLKRGRTFFRHCTRIVEQSTKCNRKLVEASGSAFLARNHNFDACGGALLRKQSRTQGDGQKITRPCVRYSDLFGREMRVYDCRL